MLMMPAEQIRLLMWFLESLSGVDANSGLVHSVTATTAKDHDSSQFKSLLHSEEQAIYGDNQ